LCEDAESRTAKCAQSGCKDANEDAGITATRNASTFSLADRKGAFLHAYAWNKDDPALLRILLNGRSGRVNIAAECAQQQWGG
jgi:hypothetical protein